MIERLATLLFHRRIIVWMVFAFVAAYGIYCWTQLPLEAYPDIADTDGANRRVSLFGGRLQAGRGPRADACLRALPQL